MADDVTILLGARDTATKVIEGVEKRLGVLSSKYTQSLNAVELGASVAIVTNAFNGLGTVIDRVRKDGVEGLSDGIREVPLFGNLIKSADNLIGAITGANAEIEEMNRLAEENNRVAAQRAAMGEVVGQLSEELQLRQQIAQAYDSAAAAALRLDAQARNQIEAINKLLENRDISESQRARLTELKGEVEKANALEVNKILDDRNERNAKAWADELKRQEELAKREQDKAFKLSQEILDLDSEINQARLRSAGDLEAAEIESIKRRYAAQIAEAERANETEKVNRLKTLEELDIAQAQKRGRGSGSDTIPSLRATEQRLLTRAPGVADAQTRASQATAKNTAALVDRVNVLIEVTSAGANQRSSHRVEARL